MNRLHSVIILLLLSCSVQSFGQDTLPKFSVRYVGNNRVIIGWVNQFESVKQISIQRSHDSLANFKTILSVADPSAVQNGFADTKAPHDHMYYRLFILLAGGNYLFSESKRPFLDTARKVVPPLVKTETEPERKDTVQVTEKEVVKEQEKKKVETFVPSFYVYTNKDGYVYLNLPDADKKKYRVRFYEADQSFLFEIKNIRETGLILDKANFLHAGWFHFELYNEDELVEKHRFYLAKEF
jgi:hypothetical protein